MDLTIRKATQEDCLFIYECRNHLSAREASKNKEEISYENHQNWFTNALSDNKRHLYIVEEEGIKIGNLRFDIEEGNKAEISISINPEMYGKGYGSEVIKLGTFKFLEDSPQTQIIRAEMLQDNKASNKVFEKAGYIQKPNTSQGLSQFWFTR